MSDLYNQVDSMIRSSRQLPHGPARLGVVEEAVRLCDVHQDQELGFWARRELMSVCNHLGLTERIAVALTWALARCDEDPERFDEESLLWPCKWPAENLVRFPSVKRAQIEALLDDVSRRFERQGASLRPLLMYRARVAASLGDPPDAAHGWLDAADKLPRDEYSDCLACETNLRAEVLLQLGALDEALEVAAPILSGAQSCMEVPHVTLGQLLLPLWRAGRVEEARKLQRRGWPLVFNKQPFVREIAAHMDVLVMSGELDDAAQALERHVRWAMETLDGSRQLAFWMAVEALGRRFEGARAPWRLPDELPITRHADGVAVAELVSWSQAQVDALAAQYTARDGHDGVARRVAAHRAMHAAARGEA